MDPHGTLTEITHLLLRCGVPPWEPYVARLLAAQRANLLGLLKSKARIRVPNGRQLLGVLDETGVLQPGQVFIQLRAFSSLGVPLKRRIEVRGDVIVTKNPCLHPGDVRRLQAVFAEGLAHLVDVVVFPQSSTRPITDQISGSDLDGDVYWCCWEEALIPDMSRFVFQPPLRDFASTSGRGGSGGRGGGGGHRGGYGSAGSDSDRGASGRGPRRDGSPRQAPNGGGRGFGVRDGSAPPGPFAPGSIGGFADPQRFRFGGDGRVLQWADVQNGYPPADYTAVEANPPPPDGVQIADLIELFIDAIKNDKLGLIANAHLALCDFFEKGALTRAVWSCPASFRRPSTSPRQVRRALANSITRQCIYVLYLEEGMCLYTFLYALPRCGALTLGSPPPPSPSRRPREPAAGAAARQVPGLHGEEGQGEAGWAGEQARALALCGCLSLGVGGEGGLSRAPLLSSSPPPLSPQVTYLSQRALGRLFRACDLDCDPLSLRQKLMEAERRAAAEAAAAPPVATVGPSSTSPAGGGGRGGRALSDPAAPLLGAAEGAGRVAGRAWQEASEEAPEGCQCVGALWLPDSLLAASEEYLVEARVSLR